MKRADFLQTLRDADLDQPEKDRATLLADICDAFGVAFDEIGHDAVESLGSNYVDLAGATLDHMRGADFQTRNPDWADALIELLENWDAARRMEFAKQALRNYV